MSMKTEALAQTVSTVAKFEYDLHNLLELMGKSDVKVMAPGSAYTIYKTNRTGGDVTITSPTQVAEAAEITPAGIVTGIDQIVELNYAKFRNLVGIESIGKYGYDIAVGGTTDELLGNVQSAVHSMITTGVFGDITPEATPAATFQAASAKAWSLIQTAYANRRFTPVYFAAPATVETYLATADISLQTAFGMTYVANFLGLGTLIIDPTLEAGKVYATAKENIDIVAADISAIPNMDMQTDESGVLGVHIDAEYSNAAIETVVYSGLAAFPVFADKAFIVNIGA